MGINRRQFSLLLASSLFSPGLMAETRGTAPLFASAAKTRAGEYQLRLIDQQGKVQFSHTLPARAHHVERHPNRPLLAVVGRRPETFIDLLDYQNKTLLQRIHSSPGQHFYGHAIFSPDGRYLISSENQINTGEGLIVVRDLQQKAVVIRQFSSAGTGPHELKMMPDGRTLVVANGGILTHPNRGREKLNLETMQPSLAYLDLASGQLLEQVFMPQTLHQLSIRHFDINPRGRVAIALQYQGAKSDDVPLVAFHTRSRPLQLVRAPAEVNLAMKQYCGSARYDRSGQVAAISSPRGNLVTFWNEQGEYLSQVASRDGCGLAATPNDAEFLITTGRGRCYRYNASNGQREKVPLSEIVAWDNHLSSFS
ncbi:DUF1513 domain-containing protein [Neptuniibacter halophilus]|uniref:DUF1513 domain-containing protein n=1 Tax=Neptuniibacter halophilus TaxID=651666 RepID=UPI002573318F|nr:DUF1513 domain-containing protein [Neptuniibacter halophilus]